MTLSHVLRDPTLRLPINRLLQEHRVIAVAGDELRARVTHVERGPGSRPERGVLVSRFELLNQRDELVISFDAHVVMLRREPLAA